MEMEVTHTKGMLMLKHYPEYIPPALISDLAEIPDVISTDMDDNFPGEIDIVVGDLKILPKVFALIAQHILAVFPTGVGVYRISRLSSTSKRRFPHRRGGVPNIEIVVDEQKTDDDPSGATLTLFEQEATRGTKGQLRHLLQANAQKIWLLAENIASRQGNKEHPTTIWHWLLRAIKGPSMMLLDNTGIVLEPKFWIDNCHGGITPRRGFQPEDLKNHKRWLATDAGRVALLNYILAMR